MDFDIIIVVVPSPIFPAVLFIRTCCDPTPRRSSSGSVQPVWAGSTTPLLPLPPRCMCVHLESTHTHTQADTPRRHVLPIKSPDRVIESRASFTCTRGANKKLRSGTNKTEPCISTKRPHAHSLTGRSCGVVAVVAASSTHNTHSVDWPAIPIAASRRSARTRACQFLESQTAPAGRQPKLMKRLTIAKRLIALVTLAICPKARVRARRVCQKAYTQHNIYCMLCVYV